MKSIFASVFALLLIFFSSCSISKDPAIPEIDTDLTKNFRILIRKNIGESDPVFINVSSSTNYDDFKNNVGGYQISKITFKVKNYNAPQDMYLNGTLICSNEEETEVFTIGSINKANLAVLEADAADYEMVIAAENKDKLHSWLYSPGSFKAKSGYTLTNADGTLFTIGQMDVGSNFLLVVTFHLTVKTKV